jgi:hypothetical protein
MTKHDEKEVIPSYKEKQQSPTELELYPDFEKDEPKKSVPSVKEFADTVLEFFDKPKRGKLILLCLPNPTIVKNEEFKQITAYIRPLMVFHLDPTTKAKAKWNIDELNGLGLGKVRTKLNFSRRLTNKGKENGYYLSILVEDKTYKGKIYYEHSITENIPEQMLKLIQEHVNIISEDEKQSLIDLI